MTPLRVLPGHFSPLPTRHSCLVLPAMPSETRLRGHSNRPRHEENGRAALLLAPQQFPCLPMARHIHSVHSPPPIRQMCLALKGGGANTPRTSNTPSKTRVLGPDPCWASGRSYRQGCGLCRLCCSRRVHKRRGRKSGVGGHRSPYLPHIHGRLALVLSGRSTI